MTAHQKECWECRSQNPSKASFFPPHTSKSPPTPQPSFHEYLSSQSNICLYLLQPPEIKLTTYKSISKCLRFRSSPKRINFVSFMNCKLISISCSFNHSPQGEHSISFLNALCSYMTLGIPIH